MIDDDEDFAEPHDEPEPEPEPSPAPPKTNYGALVQRWVDEHLANSPIARSVEAWNHLTARLPALVDALNKET